MSTASVNYLAQNKAETYILLIINIIITHNSNENN